MKEEAVTRGNRKRIIGVFLLLLATIVSGQAQKKAAPSNVQQLQARHMQQVDSIKEFREEFIKASEEYKASLQKLLALYENDVQQLIERSAKWKELYAYGLISRQEYMKATSDMTEAQVKVDMVRKQIVTAEITIAEARREPQPDELRNAEMAAGSEISPAWTTGNTRIDSLIRENGARYGVNPFLIYCVIQQESSFSSTALSVKGAQGLMQLMPGTAARYGVINANDPAQNIRGGTRYLKDLLQLFQGVLTWCWQGTTPAKVQSSDTVRQFRLTKRHRTTCVSLAAATEDWTLHTQPESRLEPAPRINTNIVRQTSVCRRPLTTN
jgi:soluble lytic murein transglycosylase-like protein